MNTESLSSSIFSSSSFPPSHSLPVLSSTLLPLLFPSLHFLSPFPLSCSSHHLYYLLLPFSPFNSFSLYISLFSFLFSSLFLPPIPSPLFLSLSPFPPSLRPPHYPSPFSFSPTISTFPSPSSHSLPVPRSPSPYPHSFSPTPLLLPFHPSPPSHPFPPFLMLLFFINYFLYYFS